MLFWNRTQEKLPHEVGDVHDRDRSKKIRVGLTLALGIKETKLSFNFGLIASSCGFVALDK